MKLYLVQHAKHKPEKEDPDKSLSNEGRNDANKVATFLKNLKVSNIFHSGKLRAQQTAEIFSSVLTTQVEKADSLEPLANPHEWTEKLENIDKDIMLVGHLPHLSKLVSILLYGTDEKQVIGFEQGGMVCLEKNDVWLLKWIISPHLL